MIATAEKENSNSPNISKNAAHFTHEHNPQFGCLYGATVLLVDDSPDVLFLCAKILQMTKAITLRAQNGLEALDLLQRESPTAVLMDLQMPVITGFEAVKRMRQLGYRQPIVAMTAHALDYAKERDNCIKLGFSELITKPFGKNKLIEVTTHLIQHSPCFEHIRNEF
jgi:two-component system, chemotaxis family, CheB/CheR fusion protein